MNTPQQFQLIDGTFTPSEASRVLLSLVNSKMDYHRLEQLSNQERFGQDTSHSEVRLRNLAKLHADPHARPAIWLSHIAPRPVVHFVKKWRRVRCSSSA